MCKINNARSENMAKKYGSKSDKTMVYIISIFGLLMVALTISFIFLKATETTYEYDQFDHLYDFSTLDQQSEDLYGVYYYQESCAACNSIKQQTLEFVDDNSAGFKVYLMDAQYTTGDKTRFVFGDQTLQYTPTMMIFQNGVLVDMLVGSDNILPFYSDVENGNY
jgi:thiol-disulfide isomerase/thioredoxin